MTVIRCRFCVRGRVQGVGFRRFVQRAAATIGLVGFVRNEVDGSVRGEAEGSPEQLQELQRQLQRGPMFARVDAVDIAPMAPVVPREPGFQIVR